MTKLTKALTDNMTDLLKEVADGKRLLWHSGVIKEHTIGNSNRRVNSRIVQGLVARDLIKANPRKYGQYYQEYELTPAGIAYARERGWLPVEAPESVAETADVEPVKTEQVSVSEIKVGDVLYSDIVGCKTVSDVVYKPTTRFGQQSRYQYKFIYAEGGSDLWYDTDFAHRKVTHAQPPSASTEITLTDPSKRRVHPSDIQHGDAIYARGGIGIVKHIATNVVNPRGGSYDLRLDFVDGRSMFLDLDYLVHRNEEQPPAQQFTDAATHVAVDREIDKRETELGNWQTTAEYARKLEAELAALRGLLESDIVPFLRRVVTRTNYVDKFVPANPPKYPDSFDTMEADSKVCFAEMYGDDSGRRKVFHNGFKQSGDEAKELLQKLESAQS